MPIFEARPVVVERTPLLTRGRDVHESDGSLSESGFGSSNPVLSGPDAESPVGGRPWTGPVAAPDGGWACGFD